MSNESKIFHVINNVNLEDIINAVTSFLNVEKQMEVQSSPTTDGYVMQASQAKDGWKTISGTRLAISIQFILVGDTLNVMIGEGTWSDKLGAGALGFFLAWPLALTAGYGTYKQKKLPSEIFAVVEKTIYTGGYQVVVNSAGTVINENQIACPSCKAINPSYSKFCNKCGAKLQLSCPNCGNSLLPDSKFCNNCGTKIE